MKLKAREIEILQLLAQGLSDKEIASQLFIESSSVRWYNSQIYSKLAVSNRQEAAEKAVQLGLLEEHDATEPVKDNLPAQTTPFIGRKQALAELTQLFSDQQKRLITILAPGGMGKTRLALALGEQFAELRQTTFVDGIFFVSLQSLTDSQHMVSHIASSIGLQFLAEHGEPRQQLLTSFKEKQLLLIMDNCEHLLDGVSLVTEILHASPHIRVLATSREKLNLSGETVYSLKGMDVPTWETLDDAFRFDAVRLFVQSAERVKPDWVLTENHMDDVARICRLTQGMPLGIVLATAWIDTLSIKDIADEIQENVDFLASELRDTPERQHSIQAIFEYSWKQLQVIDQQVFMKLSVFRGGFTRKAAQVIAGTNARVLQVLVNIALLTRDNFGRYHIHELLRQYAEGQLLDSDEAETVQEAHSQYFLNWLAEREVDIKGQNQFEALSDIDIDFANLQTAWQWALHHEQFEWIANALECLTWFTIFGFKIQEGPALLALTEKAVEKQSEMEHIWLQVFVAYQCTLKWSSLTKAHQRHAKLQQALELAQKHEHQALMARCLFELAEIHKTKHQDELAVQYFNECLTLFRTLGDDFYTAWTLNIMGGCLRLVDGIHVSTEYCQQSLKLWQQMGDRLGSQYAIGNLGFNSMIMGDLPEAEHYIMLQINTKGDLQTQVIGFQDVLLGAIQLLQGKIELAGDGVTEGVDRAKETHFSVALSMGSVVLSVIASLEERYTESIRLARLGRKIAVTSFLAFFADWALALAYCGNEDYEAARSSAHVALTFGYKVQGEGAMTWCLPILAILFARENEPERAIEILALAYSHPASSTGWLERWLLINRLQDQLKEQIGTNKYHALWEHGKTLDLYEIVGDWLDMNG